MEQGTLKKIITDVMVSLPNFDRYYDIYQKVSVYNDNRINPLANPRYPLVKEIKQMYMAAYEGDTKRTY